MTYKVLKMTKLAIFHGSRPSSEGDRLALQRTGLSDDEEGRKRQLKKNIDALKDLSEKIVALFRTHSVSGRTGRSSDVLAEDMCRAIALGTVDAVEVFVPEYLGLQSLVLTYLASYVRVKASAHAEIATSSLTHLEYGCREAIAMRRGTKKRR